MHLSAEGAFEGGGTSFWPQGQVPTYESPAEVEAKVLPGTEVVVRPQQGEALIWNGLLPHAGCPVISGRRHILVGSFSLLPAEDEVELEEDASPSAS